MTLKLILLAIVCTAPYFSQGQTPCITANELQLNHTSSFTSTNNAGRLEICYCPSNGGNCTWATISAGSLITPWSWKNVQVACRDLSINTGLGNPILQSTVRPADVALSSISIYPSTFSCDGTETKLSDCITLSIPTDSNVHSADVFINCLSTISSGSLRLTGSTTRHQGILEIYVSGIWQTFCPTGFDTVDANVVCQTLGYSSGIVRSFTKTGYRGGEISLSPVITGVSCNTDVTDFDSCTYQISSCSSTNIAGVTCTQSSSERTVRLYLANVEIVYGSRWGTVCNNQWTINDGQVTCRELGLNTNNVSVYTKPSSSQRPIWVSGYTCSGSESRLSTCTNVYPIGYAPSCSHSQDAGLSCTTPTTSDDEGGGLSGGAIAGIVIGNLIFWGGVIFLVIHLHKKEQARKAAAARAAGSTTTSRAQPTPNNVTSVTTNNAETVLTSSPANEITNETPQSRRSSSSSDSSSARVTDNQKDTELRKAPPPSYNEALELKQVNPRPNELEEKQHPEEMINPHVPYPVLSHAPDPAYPPPQPSYGFGAAGYPLSYGYGAPPNPYPGYYPPPVGDMAVPGPTSQPSTVDPSAPPPPNNSWL